MKSTNSNRATRIAAGVAVTVAIALVSCTTPPGPQPPSGPAPQFVINSPQEGASLAAPTFFSVQPLRPEAVSSVAFDADGEPLEVDFAGEDMYRVFYIPADFPAGPLTLTATVTGSSGRSRRRSVEVTNVPNPPSTTTVGPDGGVLGDLEQSGAVSTLTLPPGVAQGADVTFGTRTEAQVLAATGVDYAALGVTFLGAQQIASTLPLDGPVGISSGGFGPQVQPGQAVVNYAIIPDADGDGAGELVVINSASIAPNGDVVSDPVPLLQTGAATMVSAGFSSRFRSLQDGLSGPPGARLEIEASGFNPFAGFGNVAEFRSALGDEVSVPAQVRVDPADPDAQTLITSIPWLPAGPATLRLHNLSSGYQVGPFDLMVESPGSLGEPGEGVVRTWLLAAAAFVGTLPEPSYFGEAAEVKVRASGRLDAVRAAVAALDPGDEMVAAALARMAGVIGGAATDFPALRTSVLPRAIGKPLNEMRSTAHSIRKEFLDLYQETGDGEYLELANEFHALENELFWMTMELAYGPDCGALLIAAQQSCEPGPSPRPSSGRLSVPAITGMGSGPPPGGPGFGSALPRGGPSSLRFAPQQLAAPGRIVVKVFASGIGGSFSGLTDAGGYFFIPMLPVGQPFTAVAIDTVTREQRSFEGVGPRLGHHVQLFFNFADDGGGGGPVEIALDSNASGVLLDGEGIDQFRFEGVAGQQIGVGLLAAENSLLVGSAFTNTVMELITPSGASLSRRRFGSSSRYVETGVVELPESGTYFIEVSSNRTGSYQLGLAAIEAPTPIVMSPLQTTFGGEITVLGDHQFFSFEGSAWDFYNVMLSHPGGSEFDASVFVSTSSGGVRIFSNFNDRVVSSFPFSLPADGSYLIEVAPQSVQDRFGTLTGVYEVTLHNPDPLPLAIDDEITASVDPHNFSLYSFDGGSDDLLNLALLATTSDLRYFGRVFTPTPGQVIGFVQALVSNSGVAPFGESQVFALRGGGTHYVTVEGRFGDGGSYRMALTSVAAPTPITPVSPSLDLSGDLVMLGQRAFYSFEGTEADLHTFVLDHPGGSQLNATVRVRAPNPSLPTAPFYQLMELATVNTDGSDRSASTGEVTLPRSGTYILEVAGDLPYDGARNQHVGGFGVTIVTP